MKTLSLAVLALLLLSCSATKQANKGNKDDGKIRVTIIQLNDVYEIAPLGGGLYGGMSRVAHVRDSLLALNPNTFTVMAGDFLNPSLIGTLKLDNERIYGKQMIEVMNATGVDLATFGNHEFDIGLEALQQRLNESNFYWSSANVKAVKEGGYAPFNIQKDIGTLPVNESHIATFSDADGTQINVGFASVTINSNPQDFVFYEDVNTAMTRALANLKPQTDFVLGLTHLTIAQDKNLAAAFPDLRFIMGGHEHNSMLVIQGNTTIAKADANAKTIYIHHLEFDKNNGGLTINSTLFPIDNTVADQPKTLAIVNKWQDILQTKVKEVIANPNKVIYTATTPLDGTDSASRSVQTNLGGIITQGMANAFNPKVDAAIVNGGSIRIDDQLSGDITSMDVFRVLPFGGSILKVDITGALLIDVLDYSLTKRGTGAYLQRYNLERNANGVWVIGQSPIDSEATYKVAFSDFLLRGFDIPFLTVKNPGILGVYEPSKTELAYDIRKAVIYYLERN